MVGVKSEWERSYRAHSWKIQVPSLRDEPPCAAPPRHIDVCTSTSLTAGHLWSSNPEADVFYVDLELKAADLQITNPASPNLWVLTRDWRGHKAGKLIFTVWSCEVDGPVYLVEV